MLPIHTAHRLQSKVHTHVSFHFLSDMLKLSSGETTCIDKSALALCGIECERSPLFSPSPQRLSLRKSEPLDFVKLGNHGNECIDNASFMCTWLEYVVNRQESVLLCIVYCVAPVVRVHDLLPLPPIQAMAALAYTTTSKRS